MYYEILKTFLKKRTYLGFAVIIVIVPIYVLAMKLEGGHFLQMATRTLQLDFILTGKPFNGWFVAHMLMNSLWVQIPVLISFVAGDELAGEATAGTYRLILIRPVSRSRIFAAKYVTTVLYTVLFVFFLGFMSAGLALAVLGGGDLIILGREILVLPQSEVLGRFLLAYCFASWGMLTVASLAFFFSSFVENAIGPIIATMGVVIVFTLVTVLPVESFGALREYLFTYHMNIWQKAFEDPISWRDILVSALHLGINSVVMVGAAWLIFTKKDIIS
ncbi:MAG TPA: ABC transporter permease [Terriglobia bacterium]|nr:ABC transporter permease [Terriglobia bacterium]